MRDKALTKLYNELDTIKTNPAFIELDNILKRNRALIMTFGTDVQIRGTDLPWGEIPDELVDKVTFVQLKIVIGLSTQTARQQFLGEDFPELVSQVLEYVKKQPGWVNKEE